MHAKLSLQSGRILLYVPYFGLAVTQLLVAIGASNAAVAPTTAVAKDLAQEVRKWVNALEQRMTEKPAEQQTRELTNAALAVLEMGDDPQLAEAYLDRAYATQELDATSRAYGELHWLVGDAGPIKDFNAIEFNSLPLGAILVGHSDALSPEFSKRFQVHITASLAMPLRKHEVKSSYTNISLMNATSMLLLGQAIADSTVIDEAHKRLEAWIDYTRANGIHEFDSPTYYAVDLTVLAKGLKYAAAANDRQMFRTILDYFWTDIAANYFAPAGKLAGPYSRDYDFLTGAGGMDEWLCAAKWSTSNSPLSLPVSEAFDPSLYRLPDEAVARSPHSGRARSSRTGMRFRSTRALALDGKIRRDGKYQRKLQPAGQTILALSSPANARHPRFHWSSTRLTHRTGWIKQKDKTDHAAGTLAGEFRKRPKRRHGAAHVGYRSVHRHFPKRDADDEFHSPRTGGDRGGRDDRGSLHASKYRCEARGGRHGKP